MNDDPRAPPLSAPTNAEDLTQAAPEGGASDFGERLHRAQVALLGRPRFSIRARLLISLALCFLLCTAFALGSFEVLRKLRTTLRLVQTFERLDDRILRVRALADEGLLSPGDLKLVLERMDEAQEALRAEPSTSQAVAGELRPSLARYANACRALLSASAGRERGYGNLDALTPPQALELHATAAAASHDLQAAIRSSQGSIARILGLGETGPLVLLGVLLVLFAIISLAFTQALSVPIRRFKGYTARIARGDFSFISPARRYRDEFTDLAMAVNQMLAELRIQQDRIVKGAKLATMGTLTSGIAHELNNPLNNIYMTTEALMEELTTFSDEEKWHHLQDIYFETERASEIVKSLLDFTRKERPEMVLIDLSEILQSSLRLVQNEMTINNVTLTLDLPAHLPRIRGAANQLRQVFLNLFLNAVQAMPGGGTIWVRTNSHASDKICVDVRDSGVGIPPENITHIFDPFFTTKEPGKGTGLGLFVSLGTVRKLGGDIQVTSQPGHGTTFHVCLPRAEGEVI